MALQTLIVATCDVCDAKITDAAAAERRFAVDKRTVELDLCKTHAKEFDDYAALLLEVGRRHSTASVVRLTAAASPARDRTRAEVRAWLKAHGYDIGDRGRIPADMEQAYTAAHKRRAS